MKKLLLCALIACIPTLGIAVPASAHVSSFTISTVTLKGAGATIRATGTVTCSPGEIVRGQLNIDQPDAVSPTGRARGHFDGQFLNCTGSAQTWAATLTLRSGVLTTGDATLSTRTRTELSSGNRPTVRCAQTRIRGCVFHPWIQNFVDQVTVA